MGLEFEVRHEAEAARFIATVDALECQLQYRLDCNTMTITHTWVPPQLSGRGIAAELTRQALLTARAQGWQVAAECSYAQRYLERHPYTV
jgi:predicted GNAT family acetyltransferase